MAQELAKDSESFSPKAHHLVEHQLNTSDEDMRLALRPVCSAIWCFCGILIVITQREKITVII